MAYAAWAVLGSSAGTWAASYATFHMLAAQKIGDVIKHLDSKLPGAGGALWFSTEVIYTFTLMAAAQWDGMAINMTFVQLLKTSALAFVSQGLIEWASYHHRNLRIAKLQQKKLPPAENARKTNQYRAGVEYTLFGASIASVALAAIDVPANALTLADWAGKVATLSPGTLDLLAQVEISTVGFGLFTLTGATYALWTLKQILDHQFGHKSWRKTYQKWRQITP